MRELAIGVGLTFLLITSAVAAYHPEEVGGTKNKFVMQRTADVTPPVIKHRPKHLTGKLKIGNLTMDFGSGGHGWSIPLGTFPITPDDVGDWGKAHHAIGINSNEIQDKELGRTREGIEIHAADELTSAGCVVVLSRDFKKLKDAIMAMITDFGHAYLHIGPNTAAITSTDVSPLASFVYAPEALARSDKKEEAGIHANRRHKYASHHKKSHHFAMRHRHHLAVK